jgi:propanol-preferring alcohol dehydrogenase
MALRFQAMRLPAASTPLECRECSIPDPGAHQVLIRVHACGVCRTDLHLLDGELPQARYPLTPGHEIVGRVVARGSAVTEFAIGARVGVPWLGGSCGTCEYCASGRENLCDLAQFTGCTVDGGYAQYALADARFCLSLPDRYSDAEAAPLLCAGLIGYRAYRAAGSGKALGLYGFGAAAHLIAQVAIAQGRDVYAFTRPGDVMAQSFARELGAAWAGGSDEAPPMPLDAAILFAPVGALVPAALAVTRKGGRVVCAGIHMSDVPSFPYALLWGERSVASVANLTHQDGVEFMRLAGAMDLRPTVQIFALQEANAALAALREGRLRGAAVLVNPESGGT